MDTGFDFYKAALHDFDTGKIRLSMLQSAA